MANFRMDGNNLNDSSGRRVASIDGNYINDASGRRIGTVDDAKKAINGAMGGMTPAALWVAFIK